jgi:hypothetical protein
MRGSCGPFSSTCQNMPFWHLLSETERKVFIQDSSENLVHFDQAFRVIFLQTAMSLVVQVG